MYWNVETQWLQLLIGIRKVEDFIFGPEAS
jgi:hypothetical protein